MQVMIGTLRAARSFEEAGFDKGQAEALASAIGDAIQASREDLVTKDFLKAELAELKADIRGELVSRIGAVEVQIASLKSEVIRWMLGSQVTLVVILVALSNFTKAFG